MLRWFFLKRRVDWETTRRSPRPNRFLCHWSKSVLSIFETFHFSIFFKRQTKSSASGHRWERRNLRWTKRKSVALFLRFTAKTAPREKLSGFFIRLSMSRWERSNKKIRRFECASSLLDSHFQRAVPVELGKNSGSLIQIPSQLKSTFLEKKIGRRPSIIQHRRL